jgi:hypothetical protein
VINGLSTSEPRTYFKNPIDEKESDKYWIWDLLQKYHSYFGPSEAVERVQKINRFCQLSFKLNFWCIGTPKTLNSDSQKQGYLSNNQQIFKNQTKYYIWNCYKEKLIKSFNQKYGII